MSFTEQADIKHIFGVLDKNTGEDLRMSNKVTAVSKYNNISLVHCIIYKSFDCSTSPHIMISTSGIQSLCDRVSTVQIMRVDIYLHLVY